ncbi:stage II sporulation protein M [Altericista sp. CCNU0014]|uniref:stage II sporulation protein M n=1 Tax=Altericista sp. CCNU0014 TaxID=3082949 RepID=UPI00384D6D55
MDVKQWLSRQEPNWQRLIALLDRAEKQGMKRLSAAEVQELSSLYRKVSSDLSRARTHEVGAVAIEQLANLTMRSYTQIYQGGRRQNWRDVLEFYLRGFPAVVRETFPYTVISTIAFLIGALIGWWYGWRDPAFLSIVVPSHILDLVQNKGELWMGSIVGIEPMASSAIMRNNISVCISAFAGGMLAGTWTLFLLWNNGLHIGAIATLVGKYHLAYPFWAFVFPHGALELPAIFMSGGAGLLLARAIVFPGQYRRVDRLKILGGKAIQLMFGVVPMLFVAGIIEGFFSPSPVVPSSLKYLVGTVIFALLVLYLSYRPTLSEIAKPQ